MIIKDAKEGSSAVFHSQIRVIFMISDDFVVISPHTGTIEPEKYHVRDGILNWVLCICKTFMSIMDQDAWLIWVFFNDYLVLLLKFDDLLMQKRDYQAKYILIDFYGQLFVKQGNDCHMFEQIFVDDFNDLFSFMDIWVKNSHLWFGSVIAFGSNVFFLNQLVKILWESYFLNDAFIIAVIEVQFCF